MLSYSFKLVGATKNANLYKVQVYLSNRNHGFGNTIKMMTNKFRTHFERGLENEPEKSRMVLM